MCFESEARGSRRNRQPSPVPVRLTAKEVEKSKAKTSASLPTFNRNERKPVIPTAGSPCPYENVHKPRGQQRIENFSACCIFTIPVLVSHHSPLHTVAALPRRENAQKKKLQLQKNSGKDPLTSHRGTTRPTKKKQGKATLHSSSSCERSCKRKTARMRRKRKHEILHMVLTFLLGRGHAVLSITLKTHNSLAACWLLLKRKKSSENGRQFFATFQTLAVVRRPTTSHASRKGPGTETQTKTCETRRHGSADPHFNNLKRLASILTPSSVLPPDFEGLATVPIGFEVFLECPSDGLDRQIHRLCPLPLSLPKRTFVFFDCHQAS